ncbi:ABC transporter permease [Candidatus Babeliales bacterium]|nr:ABC transporter permease [Candidatus Babeliales bacterium]
MAIKDLVIKILDHVGEVGISSAEGVGRLGVFAIRTFSTLVTHGVNIKRVFFQMNYIGVNSFWVVVLTGSTIGAVLALHAHDALHRFGTDQFIGPLVYISMTREFGAVLGGIMVTARAGSAMTAELGTMRITEQIDALRTLSLDVYRYLIVPRVLATTIILPFLSLFCAMSGIAAGYGMAVYILKVNPETYMDFIRRMVVIEDIIQGVIKAAIFGFLCSIISCYMGFTTFGGAKGVGRATIQSVVYSCVTIFVANYILSTLLKFILYPR